MFTRLLNILKEHKLIFGFSAFLFLASVILRFLLPYLTFMLVFTAFCSVMLFIYGLTLHFKSSSRFAKILHGLMTVLGLIFTVSFIILEILIALPQKESIKSADAIIVLGCGTKDGKLTQTALSRADAALNYLKSNENCIAVVCGAKDSDEIITEAKAMYDYITKNGIKKERVIMENKSRDTTQNIRFAKELLLQNGIDVKKSTIGVVTSDFHLYRSKLIMKKQGFTNAFAISAKTPDTPFLKVSLCIREYFSLTLEFFGI